MVANFPANPQFNDTVVISDIKYRWNGSKWGVSPQAIVNPIVQSDNGFFDISKGNYHKLDISTSNFSVKVSFNNVTARSSRWYSEINISLPSPTTLLDAIYDNESFSSGGLVDLAFNPDGTKMYVLLSSSDSVVQYTLSTPWNIGSAINDNSPLTLGTVTTTAPECMRISSDGSKLFIIAGGYIHQYTINTPWVISTATYDVVNFQILGTTNGFFISNDGYYLYTIDAGTDSVKQYVLEEPWNIGSNLIQIAEFSVAAQEATPSGLTFTGNGKTMYVTGSTGDDINIYSLSTPWDISTATYVTTSSSFSVVNPLNLRFGDNAEKLYIIASGICYQYTTLGTQYDAYISWPTNIIWEGGIPPYLTEDQTLILEFYSPDSGTTVYGVEYINIDNT